jgi:hypothetical protein
MWTHLFKLKAGHLSTTYIDLCGRKQQPVVGENRNWWVYIVVHNVSGVYIVVPNVSGVYIVVHNVILCQQQCRSEITLL